MTDLFIFDVDKIMIEIDLITNKKWRDILEPEFSKKYFKDLNSFLKNEYSNYNVYPPKKEIFNAINHIDFDEVNVIIIGQDPYHNKNQANGIAFSINKGIDYPPSLKNILKELEQDINLNTSSVDLKNWSKQGVLLLNSILTVRENQASSHKERGWEIFTTKIIEHLAKKQKNLIFLLWGNYASNKIKKIDVTNHHILKTSHPSPLSSYRGFFGCRHFSKTNEILKKINKKEIKWV